MFFLHPKCVLGSEEVLISLALLLVAALYSSVGHGGASGYLAVLSLTSFATMEEVWLKQHAWCLNLIVAAIAFHHYHRAGHHLPRLTVIFVTASVPFALIGGYMRVGGVLYDTLLSLTLVWASVRLLGLGSEFDEGEVSHPTFRQAAPVGAGIGFVSGIVGIGGGIFLSPLMLLKRWAAPKTAAATAALFIWVNSVAGLVGSSVSGQLVVEPITLAPFAGAVLIGGVVGSKFGAEIAPQKTVRLVLVIVLLLAASRRIFEIAAL